MLEEIPTLASLTQSWPECFTSNEDVIGSNPIGGSHRKMNAAEWASSAGRQSHNLEIVSSNLTSATSQQLLTCAPLAQRQSADFVSLKSGSRNSQGAQTLKKRSYLAALLFFLQAFTPAFESDIELYDRTHL